MPGNLKVHYILFYSLFHLISYVNAVHLLLLVQNLIPPSLSVSILNTVTLSQDP